MGNIINYMTKDSTEKKKIKWDSEKIKDYSGADDEWQKWKN
jgi:hypothetical protein